MKTNLTKIWGWLLTIIGAVFFLLNLLINMDGIFSYCGWPIVILLIGLLIGISSDFKHPLGIIFVILGLVFVFLIKMPLPNSPYWIPLSSIAFGIYSLKKSKGGNKTQVQVV